MDTLNEKTIHSKTIYEGKIIKVRVDDVTLPNGGTSKREIVDHPGAVAVIALNSEGKLLLVKQFRKPLEKVIYEIPAGKLEPGEDPKQTALRELEEETGYKCKEMSHVVSFYTSPGFANELVHIYFTDSLIEGQKHLDEDEFLENIEVDLEAAVDMIRDQRIFDAKTVYAVQYMQLISS
ncbi:ADP-ribose pyrophosphatase [Scopulibacillus daqui]|uniref:ADP-ribose pyrophosphatase n=1 Tax=Scopulibacillus daqui TaxID=1469162 RepID=A0ABS2Q276_9BACL|nr:NUDIX hydrolase [Scopulibacillus daqui]MBM7646221.1 ADP-ribose pyrophosphatase [Scopulibacillus daqui]